jgi:hypothetical protein
MAVDGLWISLGGFLTLTSNGNALTGSYSPASGSQGSLPLVGWTNGTNDPSVGWTALGLAGGNDVTSWAGQYYADGNPPTIIAFRIQQSASVAGFPTAGTEVFVRSS